ncbi:hypothetical protein J2X16_002499 [Pelomonas aquatica]|uniref:Uncharacterized protein n=1 Tax=Pelomonas aquatica TaxID=431058 RepID=A0ABU1Z975_9BURK|nr:hypothetical protein [Pelomonas aquatica]MDR7297152.1 hypothetical protein [Pelomonas aquatica]
MYRVQPAAASVRCRMHSLVALGAAAALVLAGGPALAQATTFQCPALVASTARQPAYRPVPGQPRCEGFYVKNVSQPFVELVSLTQAVPGSWAAGNATGLTLRASRRRDTHLLIQPLRSSPLYRVDAQLARDAGLAWDGAPMLQATGLTLRDLGLLALAGGADPPAFVPVDTHAAGTPPGDKVYAVLRPSVAVSAMSWRGYRLAGPALPDSGWQALAGPPLFAWERVALPIPWPADGRGLRIDVRALDGQGQALPLLQFALLAADDDTPP